MSELVHTRASVLNIEPGTGVFKTYMLIKQRGVNRMLSVDTTRSSCFQTSSLPEHPCFPERHTSQDKGANGQCQTGRMTQGSAYKIRRRSLKFLGKSQNKLGFLSCLQAPHIISFILLFSGPRHSRPIENQEIQWRAPGNPLRLEYIASLPFHCYFRLKVPDLHKSIKGFPFTPAKSSDHLALQDVEGYSCLCKELKVWSHFCVFVIMQG